MLLSLVLVLVIMINYYATCWSQSENHQPTARVRMRVRAWSVRVIALQKKTPTTGRTLPGFLSY
jgi:hypothetical protein